MREFFRDILNPWRILLGVFIILFLFAIVLVNYLIQGQAKPADEIEFGVTFSQVFASEMNLDWQETYQAILDGLEVKKIRLVAYWTLIEPEPGIYDFSGLDWQIEEASKRDVEIILAVGQRAPRWPECHIPAWAGQLTEKQKEQSLLAMVEQVINRYQANQMIKIWQVENEPFLGGFGICPDLDKKLLQKEIDLVRQTDRAGRPVMLTSSGELSSWILPAMRADILGTSLYRTVWHPSLGYFKYPIPPVFYQRRANIVRWLTEVDRVILVELQAEPWGSKSLLEMSPIEQARSMDLAKFREIIEYTVKSGFEEVYLWGAEWWYWKKKEGNGAIWDEAKMLFES